VFADIFIDNKIYIMFCMLKRIYSVNFSFVC